MEVQKVVIAGIGGRMGHMMAQELRAAGYNVAGVGRVLLQAPPTDASSMAALKKACEDAATVLVSVPVSALEDSVTALLPWLMPDCVLADITSVKVVPMQAMERLWQGAVVGTHPLYGPNPTAGVGRSCCLTPGKHAKEQHVQRLEALFAAMSCTTFIATPEAHDKAMAAFQGLNFVSNSAYFAMLAEDDSLKPFITPSFQRRLDAARILVYDDGDLFSELVEANPYSRAMLHTYCELLNNAEKGHLKDIVHKAQQWWK